MVRTRAYTPGRGDVVWVDLNPVRGHEQRDTRPVLVLSPRSYNKKTQLMLAVPITSQIKGYPFEVAVQVKQVAGVALADQVRALDWQVRHVKLIARAKPETVATVQASIVALVTG